MAKLPRTQEFSTAFDIVDDELERTERRLKERRAGKGASVAKPKPEASSSEEDEQPTLTIASNPVPTPKKAPRKKRAEQPAEPIAPAATVVKKTQRQNLNVKVKAENAECFNNIYHRLRLNGDDRKKQDLLDEALERLFDKYKSLAR